MPSSENTLLPKHTMLNHRTSDLGAYLERFKEITLSKGSRAETRITPLGVQTKVELFQKHKRNATSDTCNLKTSQILEIGGNLV